MNLIDLENISGISYLFWGEENEEVPEKSFKKKYGKLTKSLSELIENYMSYEGYLLLDLTQRELICHILGRIDKANGYFEQPEKVKNPREAAVDYQAAEWYVQTEAVSDLYAKYIDCDEDEAPADVYQDKIIESLNSKKEGVNI